MRLNVHESYVSETPGMTQTRMSHRQPDNAALGAGSTSKHALSEADEPIISDKSARASMKFLELNTLERLQRHSGLPSQELRDE